MPALVFVNMLQPAPGRQTELIELLREFAVSMHAEPGRLHYSVHRPIDDPDGPVTVIQAFASQEALDKHSAWMSSRVETLVGLLDSPPTPPILLEQVQLSGHPLESFGHEHG